MTDEPKPSLSAAAESYLATLEGKNRSPKTLVAYRTDLRQFLDWLDASNVAIHRPGDVARRDIELYLSSLGQRGLTGVSRARKLAPIRGFFGYCEAEGWATHSPAEHVETPKKEKHGRAWFRPDEYPRILAAAQGNVRDYCILSVLLQTGIRVAELCALTLEDIDLKGRTLHVRHGKGMKARDIALDQKVTKALSNWTKLRGERKHEILFPNERDGGPIGERGVRLMVTKYREAAGITKKASCHAFRHTCLTMWATNGMSPYLIKEMAGHASLEMTMSDIHTQEMDKHKAVEAAKP